MIEVSLGCAPADFKALGHAGERFGTRAIKERPSNCSFTLLCRKVSAAAALLFILDQVERSCNIIRRDRDAFVRYSLEHYAMRSQKA